jgi:hypothetical protein
LLIPKFKYFGVGEILLKCAARKVLINALFDASNLFIGSQRAKLLLNELMPFAIKIRVNGRVVHFKSLEPGYRRLIAVKISGGIHDVRNVGLEVSSDGYISGMELQVELIANLI